MIEAEHEKDAYCSPLVFSIDSTLYPGARDATLGAEFSHNLCHMGDNEAIWDTKIFFCIIR